MTLCLEKEENTLSTYCLAKQVFAQQCGSKFKNLNIVVTRLTSVPNALVSFSDISGWWRPKLTDAEVMAPAHEDPLPLLQPAALSIQGGEALLFLPALFLLSQGFHPPT